jgi:hypothetical protein
MSVTLKQVVWSRLGAISASDFEEFNSLRVSSFRDLTYSTPVIYKRWIFNQPTFASQLQQTVNSSGATFLKCLGIGDGNYAYRIHAGIYISFLGQLYTFTASTNNDLVYGFDATSDRYLAYSAHAQGQTSQAVSYNEKYIKWGQISSGSPTQFISSKTYNNFNIDFAGDCSLSRNGSYCVVFGNFNSQKTITVFQGVSGSGAVRVGANITLPDSTLYSVKINNSGTRVVAMGLNTIRTYDLISGAWTQVGSTINFLQPQSQSVISLSADGTILIHRNSFYVDTFSWGEKWEKLNRIEIPPPSGFTAYSGEEGDISAGAEYLAFDIWPTPSSKAVEVYKSTISTVTYYAPEIIAGQNFSLTANANFSGTPSVLVDGLNRQITAWSASGLPQGLSINAATGLISGLATAEGPFTVTITASGIGGTSTETISLLVSSAFNYGAPRVAAVYAGTTEAQAVYYGPQLLWNVPGWEPPPAFSPSSISGLRLWLDSSVGLYDATTGGNLVTTNSAAVRRWEDRSGNGFHATGTNSPTLSLNQVNTLPALTFNGSQYLSLPTYLNGTAASFFVVTKPSSAATDNGPLLGNVGSASSSGHYPYRAGDIYDKTASSDRKGPITKPSGFFNFHLYNVTSANNSWRYLFNGGLHFSTTSNTYNASFGSAPTIAFDQAGGSYAFNGSIAEIIVYNTALSESDRLAVSEYLRAKFTLY